jgi:hypothetical protein
MKIIDRIDINAAEFNVLMLPNTAYTPQITKNYPKLLSATIGSQAVPKGSQLISNLMYGSGKPRNKKFHHCSFQPLRIPTEVTYSHTFLTSSSW